MEEEGITLLTCQACVTFLIWASFFPSVLDCSEVLSKPCTNVAALMMQPVFSAEELVGKTV